MGIGSSRESSGPRRRGLPPMSQPRRRSPSPLRGSQGGKRRRRHFFSRRQTTAMPQPALPIRYRSQYRHAYGLNPYAPGTPFYQSPSPIFYNNYNNYTPTPYGPLGLNMMLSPQQQFLPMMMPQQTPQFNPILSPQQAFNPQFMMTPQPQEVFSPMAHPFASPPYSAGAPLSTPYAQPQGQPAYNEIGGFVPISIGAVGSHPSSYRLGTRNITDWTGGGSISPGFLGPPI